MRTTVWGSAVPLLTMAVLLLSACGGNDSADEPQIENSATTAATDEDATTFEGVPIAPEHAADGVTIPESCLGQSIYVESGSVLDETTVAEICPAEPAADRVFRPSQQIFGGPDGAVEFINLPGEDGAGVEVLHLRCEDDDALAEKASHNNGNQPAGWPRDWDGTGAMPDPYCHPDYLEIGEWEHLEAFTAVWEGPETSTLGDTGQSQAEIDRGLWEQSRARAAWTP